MKRSAVLPIAVSIAAAFAGHALAADPSSIDWNKVPTKTLSLFYPGESTYQWLRSPGHMGAAMVEKGTSCVTCHNGQEAKLGDKNVKGGKIEPTPVTGKKNGSVNLNVQVAYDEQNAYFRFQWKTNGTRPGDAYPYYRFDGKDWKVYGLPRLDEPVRKGTVPAVYEDRLSMMIDDGAVANFAAQGCWVTCHKGERDTAEKPTKDQVQANALYKTIKKDDVRKYLPATRTDANASWDKGTSVEEIAKLKADGAFLDLIQWRAHRSNPVGMADDGYVLEYRNFDSGKNPFASNLDAKTKQPKFMYDEKKVGKKALAESDFNKNADVLIREQNAVAFDPAAGWKPGDMLPRYVVSGVDAAGSAADNKDVKGVWKDGTWTVVWARPLNLTNPDDKALKEGKAYNIGFAVHDDNITTRGHHISFPVTVGFGAKAAIEATRLK